MSEGLGAPMVGINCDDMTVHSGVVETLARTLTNPNPNPNPTPLPLPLPPYPYPYSYP